MKMGKKKNKTLSKVQRIETCGILFTFNLASYKLIGNKLGENNSNGTS